MKKFVVGVVLITSLLLAACTPQPAAVPAPTSTQSPPTSPAMPAPAAPQLSPEDIEWQKVIRAAQKEGKVTIYTWGYIGDTAIQIRNTFKNRYNVDVDIVTGRGADGS